MKTALRPSLSASAVTLRSTSRSSSGRPVTVHLLNGSLLNLRVEAKCRTRDLLSLVCSKLAVQEPQFFGLAIFIDGEYKFMESDAKLYKNAPREWRYPKRKMNEETTLSLYLRVRFYVDDVQQIRTRLARELYVEQLELNTLTYGMVPAAEWFFSQAATSLQLHLGDYDPARHRGRYFTPQQHFPQWLIDAYGEDYVLLNTPVMHRELRGMSHFDAAAKYSAEASKPPTAHNMHLHKLHRRKPDHSTTASRRPNDNIVWLGVRTDGLHLFEERRSSTYKTDIGKFEWRNITKLYFEKKRFEVCVNSGRQQQHKFSYYTGKPERSQYLLSLCQAVHAQNMHTRKQLANSKASTHDMPLSNERYIYGSQADLEFEMSRSMMDLSRAGQNPFGSVMRLYQPQSSYAGALGDRLPGVFPGSLSGGFPGQAGLPFQCYRSAPMGSCTSLHASRATRYSDSEYSLGACTLAASVDFSTLPKEVRPKRPPAERSVHDLPDTQDTVKSSSDLEVGSNETPGDERELKQRLSVNSNSSSNTTSGVASDTTLVYDETDQEGSRTSWDSAPQSNYGTMDSCTASSLARAARFHTSLKQQTSADGQSMNSGYSSGRRFDSPANDELSGGSPTNITDSTTDTPTDTPTDTLTNSGNEPGDSTDISTDASLAAYAESNLSFNYDNADSNQYENSYLDTSYYESDDEQSYPTIRSQAAISLNRWKGQALTLDDPSLLGPVEVIYDDDEEVDLPPRVPSPGAVSLQDLRPRSRSQSGLTAKRSFLDHRRPVDARPLLRANDDFSPSQYNTFSQELNNLGK